MLRRSLFTCVLSCFLMATASHASSDRPFKLVVGFPPGTGPDLVARSVSQKMGEGQTLIVENRTGAGGQIAANAVAKSPADGHTLLLGEAGSVSIAPATHSKLPYDPAEELVPVIELARADFVLVVPTSSPVQNLDEFIASARSNRLLANFATFGIGTPAYLGAEMLADLADFKIEPVHYRDTGAAISDLISGTVDATLITPAMAAGHVASGKMRALAITAPERSPLLPDVPTFKETGWPQMQFAAWFTVFAPAGTPAPTLDELNRQLGAAVQNPEVTKVLNDAGFTVTATSRAAVEEIVKSEAELWQGIVKAKGFKLD